MAKERFKVIPAVYLLLEKDGQVLLLKRANTGYMDGWYSLPAGHHDGGQTMTESMCREAKEEVGLDLMSSDLEFVHVMHRNRAADGERVDFYFRCRLWAGKPTNLEPDKCASLDWYPLADLPENVIDCVRHALEAIIRGEDYSENQD